jgi:hypothetical protein
MHVCSSCLLLGLGVRPPAPAGIGRRPVLFLQFLYKISDPPVRAVQTAAS